MKIRILFEWRKNLFKILLGILTGGILSVFWGIILLLVGFENIKIPFNESIISCILTSFFVNEKKKLRIESFILNILLGSMLFIFLTFLNPWNLSYKDDLLMMVLGSFGIIIISIISTRIFLKGIELKSFDRFEIEILFSRILIGLGLIFFTVIVFFPFIFMIISSFKTQMALMTNPTDLSLDFSLGIRPLFKSYYEVWSTFQFKRFILISLIVSIGTVLITLILSIFGAYAVSRLRFPGRNWLSKSILIIYMFPLIVLVIPLYTIFSQLQLRNSLFGLLIVYPASTLPIAIYLLKDFFSTLPLELEEAGMIDGCSRINVIWKITFPLSLPAIASVALYVFMIAWNEFLFAFMFLDDPSIFTISRGLVSLDSSEVPRQYLMAGSVLVTVPVMIIFFWCENILFQDYLLGQ